MLRMILTAREIAGLGLDDSLSELAPPKGFLSFGTFARLRTLIVLHCLYTMIVCVGALWLHRTVVVSDSSPSISYILFGACPVMLSIPAIREYHYCTQVLLRRVVPTTGVSASWTAFGLVVTVASRCCLVFDLLFLQLLWMSGYSGSLWILGSVFMIHHVPTALSALRTAIALLDIHDHYVCWPQASFEEHNNHLVNTLLSFSFSVVQPILQLFRRSQQLNNALPTRPELAVVTVSDQPHANLESFLSIGHPQLVAKFSPFSLRFSVQIFIQDTIAVMRPPVWLTQQLSKVAHLLKQCISDFHSLSERDLQRRPQPDDSTFPALLQIELSETTEAAVLPPTITPSPQQPDRRVHPSDSSCSSTRRQRPPHLPNKNHELPPNGQEALFVVQPKHNYTTRGIVRLAHKEVMKRPVTDAWKVLQLANFALCTESYALHNALTQNFISADFVEASIFALGVRTFQYLFILRVVFSVLLLHFFLDAFHLNMLLIFGVSVVTGVALPVFTYYDEDVVRELIDDSN